MFSKITKLDIVYRIEHTTGNHFSHSYLEEVRSAGENAAEFFQLYHRLTQPTYWKFYLALQGALLQIGQLLTKVHS